MKKGIILLNGDPYHGNIDTDDAYVLCADGALQWAERANVKVDSCLGDFDSLGFVPNGAYVYPSEKDLTDGEIALDILTDKGFNYIEIFGGSGKREDHFLGNIGLLIKAHERGVKAIFKSDYSEFFVTDKTIMINQPIGTVVSLFPISETVHINGSEGLKYDMTDLTIKLGESRGISNVITKEKAAMYLDDGKAIFFVVRKL